MKFTIFLFSFFVLALPAFAIDADDAKKLNTYAQTSINELKSTGVSVVCIGYSTERLNYFLSVVAKEVPFVATQMTVKGNGSVMWPYNYCLAMNRK